MSKFPDTSYIFVVKAAYHIYNIIKIFFYSKAMFDNIEMHEDTALTEVIPGENVEENPAHLRMANMPIVMATFNHGRIGGRRQKKLLQPRKTQ